MGGLEFVESGNSARSKAPSAVELVNRFAREGAVAEFDEAHGICRVQCRLDSLPRLWDVVHEDLGYIFATLVADEKPAGNTLTYAFYHEAGSSWLLLELALGDLSVALPSVVDRAFGPSIDWHGREVEDLFGISFEGHPRLGEFILHEDWPEGVNPMRRAFDARRRQIRRQSNPRWEAPTIVEAPGAFAMPIGPVYSDFAESAHFLLETVGEEVIHTIPRFFYKFRGVEKIAEGQQPDRAVLLAERFSGTSAFAHGLALCQAVEAICGASVPPRALALRTLFAELERLRHHAAAIAGICNSTALAVATSQATLIEEDLLRLTCAVARHRYLFGVVELGGVACDLGSSALRHLNETVEQIADRLRTLHEMLRYSSSFLDRLEEVGLITTATALSYGMAGPIARASGVGRDMRKLFPYADYRNVDFSVPLEQQGDGYARLRLFFAEAEQAASIIRQVAGRLPSGSINGSDIKVRPGTAITAVEAPGGAAFHWVRLDDDGRVARYRITPPSFANWHGFHLAAENFAFQDFPIILASFGLSNAECDR